jgi:endonuclease-3
MSDSAKILDILKKTYRNAECALSHDNAWQLLIATILSAQCTDARVNMVTPALFKKYPTPKALGRAPLPDVEKLIRSTGFYHSKAQSIVLTSREVAGTHGGEVPKTMDELLKLRGVARKTANVVLGVAHGIAVGVVVDTHVRRVSNRLGFTKHQDPVKIEKDLMKIVPEKDWIWYSHAIITHGRKICKAPTPLCPECPVEKLCPSAYKFPAFQRKK